ncbi:hypothetical protein [Parasegetibacter sp. NRK P23]|uniref:hypothetical protein n=1 Tax=Parasegetibacter sp. NRK P23 TaxID=2942999 RepID=UPI0020440D96|nr:hypothetical protein [Parasegetibacter sp. NRK P23]MCM5528968.1 hypothetical protein [Parasegetibacter sp. NRK P23]
MDKSLKIALILSATDRASAVIGRAMANAERRAKSLERAGKTMSDMGDKSLVAGAAMSAGLLGTLKAAADVERMQIALRTSFKGSEEEANRAFGIINKFAAATPYGLQEVMTGFIKLKNMGLDPSMEALNAYGNTASAMGKSLNDMVEAVADAATGEFERLKEFGIKASSQGKFVTFTFQGVKTTVRKESAAIEQYLKKVGNVNFAGGIDAQSKSLYGQFSTTVDGARMVAASLGKILIPPVNELFKRIGPVLERIQKWIDANPKLSRQIMMTASAVAIALLGFGAVMKVIGFVLSGFSTALRLGSMFMRGFSMAITFGGKAAALAVRGFQAARFAMFALQYGLKFTIIPALQAAGSAILKFGTTLLASPITWYIAAAVALGAAVYFIIKNWDKIKAFFGRLWESVKQSFSRFWNWAKQMFLNYTPHGLIIKHWDKIGPMFVRVWNNVKAVFTGVWNWIKGLGKMFFDAGKNIVNSIWNGMKALAMKPVEMIKNIVGKIRKFLPFSPAKEGPLKDIHRIRLVETIAQSITPKPLLTAFSKVTGALFGQMSRPMPVVAGVGGSSGGAVFNLTINLSGSASQADGEMVASSIKNQMEKWWNEKQRQQARTSFS